MTNYVSFLLETRAAKRRLARLFESETRGSADHRLIAIVPHDRSHATQTSVAHERLFAVGQELLSRPSNQAKLSET
jgi:hypothetical protein